MEQFKNKKVLAAVAVFLILAVLGGALFLTRSKNASPVSPTESIVDSELPTLDPSDIGMVVTLRPDGKALMFEIAKADDIQTIEYTIEYEKEIEGERVPEGIFGLMNIGQDGITKTDYREFGTCSSGRCRYDNVVSDITIILKVTKKDGKEYQVEKIVKL
ncbi:MAG: hypothetical protein US51_C0040G0002 [Microgenomates group bacterium GW2011_GWA2_37_6]|nr:MAG: hypothetical protein US51_C0040G0002 [Microgenomates group bacterium GW2011_GWA2_37_6]